MNSKDAISVLIPDGESHLTIQVILCLSRERKYKIHVLSSRKNSEIRFSRYVSHFTYNSGNGTDREWIETINREVSKFDIDVIMPVFETGIRSMIANKEFLTHPERLVPLPELGSFDIAIDKWQLYLHCTENNLPCPKTQLYKGTGPGETFKFPLVVKPATGFGGGMGIQLLGDPVDLVAYFKNRQAGEHGFILQEWVEGIDFSCSLLCHKGEVLAYTIQRSKSGQTGKFGPQMAYRFEKNKEILDICASLMKSLNWSGIASMDLRYDLGDEHYKILEVNTRFWRSLAGSMHAGVNFPVLLADLARKLESWADTDYDPILFYDLKGVIPALKRQPRLVFNFRFWNKNTVLSLLFSDPVPYMYKFVWRTRNILHAKIKKARN